MTTPDLVVQILLSSHHGPTSLNMYRHFGRSDNFVQKLMAEMATALTPFARSSLNGGLPLKGTKPASRAYRNVSSNLVFLFDRLLDGLPPR